VVLLNGADDHGILHWGTLTRKLLTKKKTKKKKKKKKWYQMNEVYKQMNNPQSVRLMLRLKQEFKKWKNFEGGKDYHAQTNYSVKEEGERRPMITSQSSTGYEKAVTNVVANKIFDMRGI